MNKGMSEKDLGVKRQLSKISDILKGEECLKKYKTAFCVILLAALILELFIFNFRSVESLFNRETEITGYDVLGAAEISDGVYEADSDQVSIEVNDIDKKLKNVYIDLNSDADYITIQLGAKDEGNALGMSAPEREIVRGLRQTKYIRTHFGGEVKSLQIDLKNIEEGSQFELGDIVLNAKVPVCFSFARFLFVLGFLLFLYIFRPKSFVYGCVLDWKKRWQKYAIIAMIVIQTACIWSICHINPYFLNPTSYHPNARISLQEYDDLAQAFLNGHVYLDEEPSATLQKMENPYDSGLRSSQGVRYEWDRAYYNGKYYVYFGVVPVLMYNLPYRALTGQAWPDYLSVFLNCSAACAAIAALLYAIIKKWFKNTPFGVYMLMTIIMMDNCGFMYFAKHPDMYSVPIITAVMFTVIGLTLWINSEKTDIDGKKYLSTKHLAVGAVCMALVSGCRPQLLLATVIGIIFFWRAVFKERLLFSKSSVKSTVAICLPYVIIGAGMMLYNYSRFGSPFDFGANYNLTTNDMTVRGIVMDRNITGLFYYFLQPLNVDNVFPYLHYVRPAAAYQGVTIAEKTMGGLLWLTPITFLGVRGFLKRKWYEKSDMRPYYTACAAAVISVVIALADAQMAGILSRYYADFAWLMILASAIAFFAEYGRMSGERKNILIKILIVCFVIAVLTAGFSIFDDVSDNIVKFNGGFYYKMKYLTGFLL